MKIKCRACHKEFNRKPSHIKKRIHNFCSVKCFLKHQRKNKLIQDKIRICKEYKAYVKYLQGLPHKDIFWFAGFWEGEGGVYKRNNTNLVFDFNVTQKDVTSIKYIKKLLGEGFIVKNKTDYGIVYRYSLYRAGKILALLEYIKPIIHGNYKKKQIDRVLIILKKVK